MKNVLICLNKYNKIYVSYCFYSYNIQKKTQQIVTLGLGELCDRG